MQYYSFQRASFDKFHLVVAPMSDDHQLKKPMIALFEAFGICNFYYSSKIIVITHLVKCNSLLFWFKPRIFLCCFLTVSIFFTITVDTLVVIRLLIAFSKWLLRFLLVLPLRTLFWSVTLDFPALIVIFSISLPWFQK